jgi:hypothetical protein
MPFVTARISYSAVLILLLHKGISLLRHAHTTKIIGGSGLKDQSQAITPVSVQRGRWKVNAKWRICCDDGTRDPSISRNTRRGRSRADRSVCVADPETAAPPARRPAPRGTGPAVGTPGGHRSGPESLGPTWAAPCQSETELPADALAVWLTKWRVSTLGRRRVQRGARRQQGLNRRRDRWRAVGWPERFLLQANSLQNCLITALVW